MVRETILRIVKAAEKKTFKDITIREIETTGGTEMIGEPAEV